jgi:hypothetical protein
LPSWEPEKVGMQFVAQTGNPLPLRVEDVHAARAELESKGVTFFGDTLDTGPIIGLVEGEHVRRPRAG